MSLRRISLLLMFVICIGFYAYAQNTDPIFPLAEGNYWVYETTRTYGEEVEIWYDTLRVLSKEKIEGLEGWNLSRNYFEINFLGYSARDTLKSSMPICAVYKGCFGEYLRDEFIFPESGSIEMGMRDLDVLFIRRITVMDSTSEFDKKSWKIDLGYGFGEIVILEGVGITEHKNEGEIFNGDGKSTKQSISSKLIDYSIKN